MPHNRSPPLSDFPLYENQLFSPDKSSRTVIKGKISKIFRVAFLVLGIIMVFTAAGGILIFLTVNAISFAFGFSPDAARKVMMAMLFVWIVVSLVFSIILVKNHSKE